MDVVELALSEGVAVPELMGSENFGDAGGDVGPALGKAQAGQSEAKIPHAHPSEPASDPGHLVPNGLSSSFHGSNAPKDLKLGFSQSLIASAEAIQRHRRSGKAARSSDGSERSRILQMELSVNESGVEDIKGNSSVTGTCPAKCKIAAKIPHAHPSEPASDPGRLVPNGLSSSFHGSNAPEDLKLGFSQSLIASAEAIQRHRRSGKVARSSGGSERSRILQMELSVTESGVEDMKGNSSVPGTCPAKCIIAEKAQMPKQRNNSNGRRGDKRSCRVPKSKCDSFCLKNGLVSFSSVAGGGNFLAAYGSKSDIFDVTKPVDELPLNELLDGSYKCPILAKDKGKAVENLNEDLLNSVRKACSLLRLKSPVYTQNSVDIDNSCNQMVLMGPCSSGTSPSSRIDSGKADSCSVNRPSSNKDSWGYMEPPAFLVDSSLHSPKNILERLALHPSKDLDSLLLDAVKPASLSRNSTDLRLGKAISNRTGLLPFPWSHNSFGHSKSGPDTVKLSANRTTCPGRWVKVENTLTPLKGSNGLLVDLKSLTYNHRLVPSGNLESASLGVENASSTCLNINSCEPVVLSSAACSASQVPPAEYSPRLLAAAQTLCQIASHSSKQNSYYTMKQLKKPSQNTMKACKLKSIQKSENLFVTPEASIRPDNLVKVVDGVIPAKKLRLSVNEKTDAVSHAITDRKVPVNWPPSRSVRSSPSKLFSDSVSEMKNYNNHIVKKSCMMTPSTRVIDKACNGRQKLKKIVPME